MNHRETAHPWAQKMAAKLNTAGAYQPQTTVLAPAESIQTLQPDFSSADTSSAEANLATNPTFDLLHFVSLQLP